MQRIWSLPIHASIWLCLTACPSQDSSKAAPSKVDAAPAASPTQGAAQGVTPTPPEPAPEQGSSEPAPKEPGPAPAWFSPSAFEHVTIVRQDLAGARVPSGQTSAMIVLELPAATTPEQCIAQARAKIGETVKDPPIESLMPQGHLSLRGSGDNYEYTVVCGMAKDKPTMFLSYSQ